MTPVGPIGRVTPHKRDSEVLNCATFDLIGHDCSGCCHPAFGVGFVQLMFYVLANIHGSPKLEWCAKAILKK